MTDMQKKTINSDKEIPLFAIESNKEVNEKLSPEPNSKESISETSFSSDTCPLSVNKETVNLSQEGFTLSEEKLPEENKESPSLRPILETKKENDSVEVNLTEQNKPIRLVLEPMDQTDPIPHEWSDYLGMQNIEILGASVRGWLKAHEGKWRDDSCMFDTIDNWLIVAVADGGGSAPLSRIGAKIAVTTAVENLKKLLADFRLVRGKNSTLTEGCIARLQTFLSEACHQSISNIRREAMNRQHPLKDFETTLLILIQTTWKGHDIIGTIHVGDGQIGLLNIDNECELLITPDHGQWAGEVVFLTAPEIEPDIIARAKVCKLDKPFKYIVLATDGVTDHFEPVGKFLHNIFVGEPISQELRLINQDGKPLKGIILSIPSDCTSAGALLEWLKFGQLEPDQAWDDRTLVLIRRKEA